jgi:IS30 family transposase
MSYQHFSAKERHTLMILLHRQLSYRVIGLHLNRHHTTISREVKRNLPFWGPHYHDLYADKQAQRRKNQARHHRKRDHQWLYSFVLEKLQCHWSPDVIHGYLKRVYPKSSPRQLSAECIYHWIYHDAHTGGELYQCLSSQHKKRKAQRRAGRLSRIPDRIGIEHRPAVVDRRHRLGDWEGDTVEGCKGGGGLAMHVERKSRFLMAEKLSDGCAATFTEATKKCFKLIPEKWCKTLTLDNGNENVQHRLIEKAKQMPVYFAHPYSPWERGTNEQTNGLLRRYFPKGTDFRKVTERQLKKAVSLINQRPRKSLNYRTPEAVFFKAVNGAL